MILVVLDPEDIEVLLELVEKENFADEKYKKELLKKLKGGIK